MPALALLLAFVATSSLAAEISFELYERKKENRALIGKGTKTYAESDFSVRRVMRNGGFYAVRKELPLYRGYSIGMSDTQKLDVSGFGLWVGHLPFDSNPNDFSWEWYDRLSDGLYEKRQGASKIKVMFTGLPVMREVHTIQFLEDTEFRYIEDLCCKPEDDGPTHVLLIRADSVLIFPVAAN